MNMKIGVVGVEVVTQGISLRLYLRSIGTGLGFCALESIVGGFIADSQPASLHWLT